MTTNYFVLKAKKVWFGGDLYEWYVKYNDDWFSLTKFCAYYGPFPNWKLNSVTKGLFYYWVTLEKDVS